MTQISFQTVGTPRSGSAAIDPEIFGAIGDGVTDDTKAITEVDSYADGLGRAVDLGGKTYYTTIQSSAIQARYYNGTLLTLKDRAAVSTASGTFTSADDPAKTITVTNGLITGIVS